MAGTISAFPGHEDTPDLVDLRGNRLSSIVELPYFVICVTSGSLLPTRLPGRLKGEL